MPTPTLWLEDVGSARAMAWVNAENAKTLKVLESDPRYPDLHAAALKVAETQDRIPTPHFLAGDIYNFWQDAEHVRGLWRKTTLADYRNPTPRWSKVLDLDVLAKSEGANWVWEGADCLHPAEARCLVSLSDGGEDAVTIREFDLPSRQFAQRGFDLPKAKQTSAWVDHDQVLISSDFGPGTLTESGYPYIVKSLRRGEPFTAAREVFRGTPKDVAVDVSTWVDGSGDTAVLLTRGVSFFENKYYLMQPSGPQELGLPLKSEIKALLANRLLFTINEPWDAGGAHFDQGALLSLDLGNAGSDPRQLHPVLVYMPGPRESLGDVGATRHQLVVTLYENVKGSRAHLHAHRRRWVERAEARSAGRCRHRSGRCGSAERRGILECHWIFGADEPMAGRRGGSIGRPGQTTPSAVRCPRPPSSSNSKPPRRMARGFRTSWCILERCSSTDATRPF